jgi:hypothetical protein
MAWLLREDEVLAALEDRRPGWQASLESAIVLRGPVLVQTLTPSGARPLDVAWCAPVVEAGRSVLRVRRIKLVGRHRILPPRLGSGDLIVAPAGTFERWRLQVGDYLEVHGQ